MANIEISELSPLGSDLFRDSESFLSELSEDEMTVSGGDPLVQTSLVINSFASVASMNTLTVGSIQSNSNAVITRSVSQSVTF